MNKKAREFQRRINASHQCGFGLPLDKEIEADIRKRWLAIFIPEDLNLTPEQVFNDVNFLIFQLDRYQKVYSDKRECPSCEVELSLYCSHCQQEFEQ